MGWLDRSEPGRVRSGGKGCATLAEAALALLLGLSGCASAPSLLAPEQLVRAIVGGRAPLPQARSAEQPPATPIVSEAIPPEPTLPEAIVSEADALRARSHGAVLLAKLSKVPAYGLSIGASEEAIRSPELTRVLASWKVAALPAFALRHAAGRSDALLRSPSRSVELEAWVLLDVPPTPDLGGLVQGLSESGAFVPGSLELEAAGVSRRASHADVDVTSDELPRASASVSRGPLPLRPAPREAQVALPRGWEQGHLAAELERIGLRTAWRRATGRGVGVAVVDTGIDRNQLSLVGHLRAKLGERPGEDRDANGVAGDIHGVGLAHLELTRSRAGLQLIAERPDDWSDWHGADGLASRDWGGGTVVAGVALGSGEGGAPLGLAPEAWLLPVDVEENLRRDPGAVRGEFGLRELPARAEDRRRMLALRTGVLSRALGVVYAVSEGARVITCGWDDLWEHPILLDALAYAVDRCAVPVCGSLEPLGSASVLPTLTSNPRNDATPLPDRRVVLRGGAPVELGIAAGVAALVLSARPDLDAYALASLVTQAQLAAGSGGVGSGPPWLPQLLRQAEAMPVGRCGERARLDAEREPLWRGRLRSQPR